MVDNFGGNDEEGAFRELVEQLVPIANVGRIMKQILPPNVKVSKEAKETMQECVSEFISFVTSEASDKCKRERRKTVNGDDICTAMSTLGFDDYADATRRYLHRYRELEEDRASQERSNTDGINQEHCHDRPPDVDHNNPAESSNTVNFDRGKDRIL